MTFGGFSPVSSLAGSSTSPPKPSVRIFSNALAACSEVGDTTEDWLLSSASGRTEEAAGRTEEAAGGVPASDLTITVSSASGRSLLVRSMFVPSATRVSVTKRAILTVRSVDQREQCQARIASNIFMSPGNVYVVGGAPAICMADSSGQRLMITVAPRSFAWLFLIDALSVWKAKLANGWNGNNTWSCTTLKTTSSGATIAQHMALSLSTAHSSMAYLMNCFAGSLADGEDHLALFHTAEA